MLNILGSKLKIKTAAYMPNFVSWNINDMGIENNKISGVGICIPPVYRSQSAYRKINSAINKLVRQGSSVIVVDESTKEYVMDSEIKIKVSRGIFYPPVILIDALKAVSALVGIDFRRSNICIADASTQMGEIVTEILTQEASYLTLYTSERDRLMKKIGKYILNTGLSPAVVSNLKKAISSCDILIFTGGMSYKEIEGLISHKLIAANLSSTSIDNEKDILIIDDVILQAKSSPVINGEGGPPISLTSKLWEGALFTLVDFDTTYFALDKALKINRIGKDLGISVKSVVSSGKSIDRDKIYRYR
jgi:hypothetical protein